jgi:hypothetical protein
MVFHSRFLILALPETMDILLLQEAFQPLLNHLLLGAETQFGERIQAAQDMGIPEGITNLIPIGRTDLVSDDFFLEKVTQEQLPCLPCFLALSPGWRFSKSPQNQARDMMRKRLGFAGLNRHASRLPAGMPVGFGVRVG